MQSLIGLYPTLIQNVYLDKQSAISKTYDMGGHMAHRVNQMFLILKRIYIICISKDYIYLNFVLKIRSLSFKMKRQ